MESVRTRQFNKLFDALPADVQRDATEAYQQFASDPTYPGLHLEPVHGKRGQIYYSARVGSHYRALAKRLPDTWLWFWIGPHSEYGKLLE